MKVTPIQNLLTSLREAFPGHSLLQKYKSEEPPLRSELYSTGQLEKYGAQLAARHQVITGKGPNTLLKRLADNEELLLEVHTVLTEAVKTNRRIIPAGEWLLDNFYLIQEQIGIGKKHLPKGYSEDLPRLSTGASEGLPRVYDMAIEIISHTDGRIDLKSLEGFITYYQTVSPLKLGELWAIPIMVRLALIENLRRLSTQIALDRMNQNLADYWAEQMIEVAEKDPKGLILVIADMARSNPPMVSSFVAELTRQLQGRGPALALPLNWIEQHLSETHQTGLEMILSEIQKQAANQVSIANSVGSLRFLGTTDWRDFVESVSVVEQKLCCDPARVYPDMDFSTRDDYRHKIEKMAKSSSLGEIEVTVAALALADQASLAHGPSDRRSHVGYYLVDKGQAVLEILTLPRRNFAQTVKKGFLTLPLTTYLVSILFLTLILGGGLSYKAYLDQTNDELLILVILLSLLSASHLVIGVVNWLVTLAVTPQLIPRMNFEKGIPIEYRTMVVIPTLLSSDQEIEHLVESLEVHFLANRDENLHFGLLTDYLDADQEFLPDDEGLLCLAKERIMALNLKYPGPGYDIFFLFHRPRRWNLQDKKWMGYERKRGKLTELNSLFRGQGGQAFSEVVGDPGIFLSLRYVITIDSDTQLPRDSARKMIATMAHPLNQAFFDEKLQRVTEGYGILQPRVDLSLPGASNSLFARMQGSDLGIDPYTRTTSDVYQDLFFEGSFTGKGIYEIDIFRKGLDGKFPENRILSHDLLEGCYLRSGLLSDIRLYEEYPSRYSADVKRRHRWVRGDWQIAAWIFPFIPGLKKGFHRNPLSALSRWKILDNLRRSIMPPVMLLLLMTAWTVLDDPLFWTASITAILLFPSFVAAVRELFNKPKEIQLRQHFRDSIYMILDNLLQTAFTVLCLPYESYCNLDAIIRTGWRLTFSHRHLLEWNPSIRSTLLQPGSIQKMYSDMLIAPILGIFGIILSLYANPERQIADPVLFLWILSPAIAWFISQPLRKITVQLDIGQKLFLRRIARKTWAWFEYFVTPEENWLPPDNYQEHPVPVIAHRTSPTNMGLSLLANLAALDFGFISQGRLLDRLRHSLSVMEALERYQGHFYNWYDTLTLTPLFPRYISSVDSGNLTGHLLTLRQGIVALGDLPVISTAMIDGMLDTLGIIRASDTKSPATAKMEKIGLALKESTDREWATIKPLVKALMEEAKLLQGPVDFITLPSKFSWLKTLILQGEDLIQELDRLNPFQSPDLLPFTLTGQITSPEPLTLNQVVRLSDGWRKEIESLLVENRSESEIRALHEFNRRIETCRESARNRLAEIDHLAELCQQLSTIDYGFLYDAHQHLFTIGFDVTDHRKDAGSYDLLASESRLGIYVGIAQGKLPQDSWFALGRQLTNTGGASVLLSWSGSMFEYLMPLLVMPSYENTLLDQTYTAVVKRQIQYGKQLGVPWGISESGYNLVDTGLNYQYKAFGVPEIGLKRGLGEDLVIAPYASVMALMVSPEEAYRNLEKLSSGDFEGVFGYFEAIDYTPSRLPRGQNYVTIRSFMAHHQGMSMLAIDYLLNDRPMQKRFESEPQFQAALLLLQERIPKATTFFSPPPDLADIRLVTEEVEMRVIKTSDTPIPEVQLLSNGTYHVMVTNAGSGYSRWRNMAVTRWQEDTTQDQWGSFCFIRDLEKSGFWSISHQPSLREAKTHEAVFSQGRAEFRRSDQDIDIHTEIIVSPEDDIEIRRMHITNRSRRKRMLELTSYAEVVLTSAVADQLHPAFSNLFVETKIMEAKNAILCLRRPRSDHENTPCLIHLMKGSAKDIQGVSYETDRMQFIGRGNSIHEPRMMNTANALSGTDGPVLDPIVSIQYRVTINPMETITMDIVTGIGETRPAAEALINKYQDTAFMDRAFELAYTHNQVVLRQINATEVDGQLYAKLASSIIYHNPALRADPAILSKNHRGQSGLWSYSISGDLPVVLLQISDAGNLEIVRQLVQAHAYWRLKGLVVDLVIWNEDHGGYRQVLQNQLLGLITDGLERESAERPGGIFVRASEQVAEEDRILIQTVARMVISDTKGTLVYQAGKRPSGKVGAPNLLPKTMNWPVIQSPLAMPELVDFNSFGGFSKDGKEYIIQTIPGKLTPLPWVNVMANPNFGTVISESGQGYTWFGNAHEYRLTPWHNDQVTDSSGECFYIRDDENGDYWSPSPLPAMGKSNYITCHGFGYSTFEHQEDGIYSKMLVFVDLDQPIKYTAITIRNQSDRPRNLSVVGYVDWVLGDLKSRSAMHIETALEPKTGTLFAKNAYNKEYNDRVCFFDVQDPGRTFTADRTEFIGRNGSLKKPEAMNKAKLSGKVGLAMDSCGALELTGLWAPGEEREIIFMLGTAENQQKLSGIIDQCKGSDACSASLKRVHAYWSHSLSSIKLHTPDFGLNALGNGWLLYQTLACRFWARSGYSQSGGAFGFRDQLQDAMAIIYAEPGLVREHILLCASRQFPEGDVQHWWHPPTGRGVRTRCSDDFLWLAYATLRYVDFTQDWDILDEKVSFIEGRMLNAEEESYYDQVSPSNQVTALYDHCCRAVRHGLPLGVHGLPLMGSGDWNDGMDKVGPLGKGESVWLAFFLLDILKRFEPLALSKNDEAFAELCRTHSVLLKKNLGVNGWDGQWYRRAYFDDGSPLGSHTNTECQIDSISQSWSILSGAAPHEKGVMAMESAYSRLVKKESSLIKLLDPPFDSAALNPGYIKGYVPGIRENGGQYTHAAIWLTMAFARLKDKGRTWELFSMISPANHAKTPAQIGIYKAEPYVLAADVYSDALHSGRGGWTWYTGSAGWMYRLIVESILGLVKKGNILSFEPCAPAHWTAFSLDFTHLETIYHIDFSPQELLQATNADGPQTTLALRLGVVPETSLEVILDGVAQKSHMISLVNDHQEHSVTVRYEPEVL